MDATAATAAASADAPHRQHAMPCHAGGQHTYPIVTYSWIRFAGQMDFLAASRLTNNLCGLHGQILDVAIQIGAFALC